MGNDQAQMNNGDPNNEWIQQKYSQALNALEAKVKNSAIVARNHEALHILTRMAQRDPATQYAPAVMDNYQINTLDQLEQARTYQLPERDIPNGKTNAFPKLAVPQSCKHGYAWQGGEKVKITEKNSITSTIRSNLNSEDDSKLEDRHICEITYEQYEQRYGIKLDEIKESPLSETFGEVHACDANTDNLKFDVQVVPSLPRQRE